MGTRAIKPIGQPKSSTNCYSYSSKLTRLPNRSDLWSGSITRVIKSRKKAHLLKLVLVKLAANHSHC